MIDGGGGEADGGGGDGEADGGDEGGGGGGGNGGERAMYAREYSTHPPGPPERVSLSLPTSLAVTVIVAVPCRS